MPRTNRIKPETLQTLEQRANKAMRKFRQATSQQKEQARSDDARRKIIGGALCENHALANRGSEFTTVYIRLLKEYVRPEDRWLFAAVFQTLLPPTEAEMLLAEGEIARLEAERVRREAKAAQSSPDSGPSGSAETAA